MKETSVIEISKSALEKNIGFIRALIGPDTQLISVIKGNAYGHGIETFLPIAVDCGVDAFAVFSAFEAGEVLRTGLPFRQLIVMGAVSDEDLPILIDEGVEFFVFHFYRLEKIAQEAKKKGKRVKIHVEIETGLNRTGFERSEWGRLVEFLIEQKAFLEVEGLCTHLAGAEDVSNYLRIRRQMKVFKRAKNYFNTNNVHFNSAHMACSAALINYPKSIQDAVRVGILQYGFWPSKEVKMAYLSRKRTMEDPLKRLISWKSSIMEIKNVKGGEFIGYGRSYLSETAMRIAIVPVGYAHGFGRSLSNLGKGLIHGVRVSVIGTVNMNMIALDVTHVPNACIGDEVVLIGDQGDLSISVSSFSDMSDQLNYELLTRLPSSIPRKIIDTK